MSKKTQTAYEHVFNFIEKKLKFSFDGMSFTTDYEKAMRNAIRNLYPEIKLVACWFHFAQAVKKNSSQINGFVRFLRGNKLAEDLYYKFQCIPLLPANYISSTYETLKREAYAIDKSAFQQFISYYEKQWIIKEGPESISVNDQEMRTTSSLEAYNKQLGASMVKHGHFFRFAATLNQQEYIKSTEMELYIKSGGTTGYKKKKAYKVNEQI